MLIIARFVATFASIIEWSAEEFVAWVDTLLPTAQLIIYVKLKSITAGGQAANNDNEQIYECKLAYIANLFHFCFFNFYFY